MYMDSVIEQTKTEFLNFKEIMAENEWLTKELEMEKLGEISANEKLNEKNKVYEKDRNLPKDKELELKLDWLLNYFNDRMNIKGHTDFVMYHSRALLKKVLTPEEYAQITRYECFAYKDKLPQNTILKEILDTNNSEEIKKSRFCMIKAGNNLYAFSTKPNKYIKLREQDLNEIQKYTHISKTEKPSDLLLNLCDRGNALPLVFNPLGTKILNERADLIDKKLSPEERKKQFGVLANSIKTTDEPITSILVPYPDGTTKYLYINGNDEITVKTGDKETIYHYNEDTDSFETEELTKDEKNKEER